MKGILCLILVSSVSKFKDTRFTRLLRLSLLIVMPQMVGHFKNLAAAMARHTLKIFKNLCFSDGTPHFTMFLDPPPPPPSPTKADAPPPPMGHPPSEKHPPPPLKHETPFHEMILEKAQ